MIIWLVVIDKRHIRYYWSKAGTITQGRDCKNYGFDFRPLPPCTSNGTKTKQSINQLRINGMSWCNMIHSHTLS